MPEFSKLRRLHHLASRRASLTAAALTLGGWIVLTCLWHRQRQRNRAQCQQ